MSRPSETAPPDDGWLRATLRRLLREYRARMKPGAGAPWPTHCIHNRPIPPEGEGEWCPDCQAADLALAQRQEAP
jgi:hypothetical protein